MRFHVTRRAFRVIFVLREVVSVDLMFSVDVQFDNVLASVPIFSDCRFHFHCISLSVALRDCDGRLRRSVYPYCQFSYVDRNEADRDFARMLAASHFSFNYPYFFAARRAAHIVHRIANFAKPYEAICVRFPDLFMEGDCAFAADHHYVDRCLALS